jgi:hypothetical protein
MRRRECVALIGGTAVSAWPVAPYSAFCLLTLLMPAKGISERLKVRVTIKDRAQ